MERLISRILIIKDVVNVLLNSTFQGETNMSEKILVKLNGKPIESSTFDKLPASIREGFSSLYSANPCNLNLKGLPETAEYAKSIIDFAGKVTKGDKAKLSTLTIRIERADSPADFREYTVKSLNLFVDFLDSFKFGKSPRVVTNTNTKPVDGVDPLSLIEL